MGFPVPAPDSHRSVPEPQGMGNPALREQVTLHPAPPDLSIPIVYPEWDRRGIEQQ